MTPESLQARIARWSEEVARDPGSGAFLPLASAYLEMGRLDAARRLCLRGLERNPTHVDAHVLLGRVYRAGDEGVKAFDEFDIALRLDPEHRDARRHMARLCVDRADWPAARAHLERALRASPDDPALHDVLRDIRAGLAGADAPARGAVDPREAAEIPSPSTPIGDELTRTARDEEVIGAVLLDDDGFVVAGEVGMGEEDRAEDVAAALAGAFADAAHVTDLLGLGEWESMVLETPRAVMEMAPVGRAVLAVAARRDVPLGRTLLAARRLRGVADGILSGAGEEAGP